MIQLLKTTGCIYLHQNWFWICSFERLYFPSAIRILSPKGRDIIVLFAQRNDIKCCIHKNGKWNFKRPACVFLWDFETISLRLWGLWERKHRSMTLYSSIYRMLQGMESPRFQFVRFLVGNSRQLTALHESSFKTVQEAKPEAPAIIVVLQHALKINVLVTLLEIKKTQSLLLTSCYSRYFFCILKLCCDFFLSSSLSCWRYCFPVSCGDEMNKMHKRLMVNQSKSENTTIRIIKGEFQFRENISISL